MIAYEFSVLRYSYDPLTQEFINIGIVLYSPQARVLQARVSTNYGRASKIFGRIDGPRFRSVLRHLQAELDKLSRDLERGLLFKPDARLERSLSNILPVDDSSLRFDRGGAGVADDPAQACERLYHRYVAGSEVGSLEAKTRQDVWNTFRAPLELLDISKRLIPKQIAAKDYAYDFDHAWKNGVWNLYEPVSFDLLEESAIREKANKWLGRAVCLRDSPDPFKLTLLLGAPQNDEMRDAFQHAENILTKIPGKKEIIREHEAEAFARELEAQLKTSDSAQLV